MATINETLIKDYIKEHCKYANELLQNNCKITHIDSKDGFVYVSIGQPHSSYYEELDYSLFDIMAFIYSKVTQ